MKSNGGLKIVLAVLGTAVTVGSVGYALMSDRVDDRCQTINANMGALHETVLRDTKRIDDCDDDIGAIREDLREIKTKLDTIIANQEQHR
jgi:peptidoglycan hydrolase CwlO-like protein